MSAYPVSVLSHGLLFDSGDFPIPYDVRSGISYGTGLTGTLTLPTTGEVASGVQYGGDGTQYTGTLVPGYAPRPIATTWTEDMGNVFDDSVEEWGDVLVYNGNQIDCEKTELAVAYEMQVSGANRLVNTAIDVSRSEAIRIGLYLPEYVNNPPVKRPVVTVSRVQFTVVAWKDDITADPTIKLICAKLQ